MRPDQLGFRHGLLRSPGRKGASMSASKYLPPFTAEERVTAAGDRSARTPVDPGALSESEVTYADFLGDEVDE